MPSLMTAPLTVMKRDSDDNYGNLTLDCIFPLSEKTTDIQWYFNGKKQIKNSNNYKISIQDNGKTIFRSDSFISFLTLIEYIFAQLRLLLDA